AAVVDHRQVPVALLPAAVDDDARGRGVDGRPVGGPEVDAVVMRAPAAAERARDRRAHGPGETARPGRRRARGGAGRELRGDRRARGLERLRLRDLVGNLRLRRLQRLRLAGAGAREGVLARDELALEDRLLLHPGVDRARLLGDALADAGGALP